MFDLENGWDVITRIVTFRACKKHVRVFTNGAGRGAEIVSRMVDAVRGIRATRWRSLPKNWSRWCGRPRCTDPLANRPEKRTWVALHWFLSRVCMLVVRWQREKPTKTRCPCATASKKRRILSLITAVGKSHTTAIYNAPKTTCYFTSCRLYFIYKLLFIYSHSSLTLI